MSKYEIPLLENRSTKLISADKLSLKFSRLITITMLTVTCRKFTISIMR